MVPNLPCPLVIPVPGIPPSPDAEGVPMDFFARLLGNGASFAGIVGQSSPPSDEITLRAAPAEDEADAAEDSAPDGTATPDIIPLLQAQSGFPVVVAPAAPAPTDPGQPVPTEAPAATASRATPRTVGAPAPQASPVAQAVRATIQAAQAAPIAAPQGEQVDDEAAPNGLGLVVKAAIEAAKTGDVVASVVKPTVGKLRGDPGVVPGRMEPVDAAPEAPARPTVGQAAQRQPEPHVSRAEPVMQPAPIIVTTSAAPAFSAAPVAPQPASVAPAPNAVPDVAALVVERQLDLVSDNQWLDRLARDIARAGASDEPLRFRLHPQTLGHLQVEVAQSDRGATVRLTVETEAARNLLIDAQPRLAAEARAQGIRLAGTEVDLGTASQQGDTRRNAEAQPQNIVRVVRSTRSDTNSSGPAQRRSDRYA